MLKKICVSACALLVLSLSVFGQTASERTKGASKPPATLPNPIVAKVVDILDGDTIRVASAEISVVTVRLEAIDAPEATQEHGQDAKKRLAELISGKQVSVQWKERDKYQRVLGYVYVGDSLINKQLVEEGWAWQYLKYNKSEALGKLEQSAKERKLGLWASANPIAPWDWREGVRPPKAEVAMKEPPPAVKPAVKAEDPTMYITDTGTHYHRAGCRHLKRSQIPIPLSRAASAYTPCKTCNPPQ